MPWTLTHLFPDNPIVQPSRQLDSHPLSAQCRLWSVLRVHRMYERSVDCHFSSFSHLQLSLLHRVQPFSKIVKALLNLSSDNLSSLPYPRFAPTVPTLANPANSHPHSPLCSLGLKTDQNEQILLIVRLNIKVTLPVQSFLACPGP